MTTSKLLMLTGARRSEIGGLRWPELDEDLTRIKLPPDRQKNRGGQHRMEFIIPLSEPARNILAGIPRVVGRPNVLGRGKRGASNWADWKKDLDQRLLVANSCACGVSPLKR
jgi:integrase